MYGTLHLQLLNFKSIFINLKFFNKFKNVNLLND